MTATVGISAIEKNFGAARTLKGVSVDVAAGEFLTLVGPSGCGKSTLLRIIAGLIPQDGGSIAIDGTPVDHLPPKGRDVSMVFQSYALYPHMSVAENIATPLRVRNLSPLARWPVIGGLVPGQAARRADIAEQVRRAAAQVEIEPLLDRRPAQLSGGQRQRVALARAMVRHPRVFLMDEPLSNLDARLRVHMRGELSALHRRLGSTFIYVTHDQIEAMSMSTRIALMLGGEVVQIATPDEIYANPTDIRVARFIGSPEINLLAGEADHEGRIAIAGHASALRTAAAGPLTVGLRPAALSVVDHGADVTLPVRLVRTERLGHDVLLHVLLENDERTAMAVCLPAAEFAALRDAGRLEERFAIGAAATAALLFDPEGKRVSLAGVPSPAASRRMAGV